MTRPEGGFGSELVPALPDLSTYVIAGQVVSHPRESPNETSYRTAAQGLDDAVEAERLGFRRIFLAERWNLKEAGSFLGGAAARTQRIDFGTGLVSPWTRHPQLMAAMGATLHACYRPNFVLGLGLGINSYFKGMGVKAATYEALDDYVRLLRQLWAGETVKYNGPAGTYDEIGLGFVYEGPQPQVWFGSFGYPKGAASCANVMDGVLLPPIMTPQASADAVTRLRQACEQAGRDPSSLRIAQCVVTAPDLDDYETRSLAHARALLYLTVPGYAHTMIKANGWDPDIIDKTKNHQRLRSAERAVDWVFHRVDVLDAATLIPDSWIRDSCATGTTRECHDKLREFRAAGADEIVIYGSTPAQNAGVSTAWRASS